MRKKKGEKEEEKRERGRRWGCSSLLFQVSCFSISLPKSNSSLLSSFSFSFSRMFKHGSFSLMRRISFLFFWCYRMLQLIFGWIICDVNSFSLFRSFFLFSFSPSSSFLFLSSYHKFFLSLYFVFGRKNTNTPSRLRCLLSILLSSSF